jgi:hypothetical protein
MLRRIEVLAPGSVRLAVRGIRGMLFILPSGVNLMSTKANCHLKSRKHKYLSALRGDATEISYLVRTQVAMKLIGPDSHIHHLC